MLDFRISLTSILYIFQFGFGYFGWNFCQIFCAIRTWKRSWEFETHPIFPLLISFSFQRLGEITRVKSFSLFVSLKQNILVLCITEPGFEFMTDRNENQFTYIASLLFFTQLLLDQARRPERTSFKVGMFVRTERCILLRVSTLKKSYIISELFFFCKLNLRLICNDHLYQFGS